MEPNDFFCTELATTPRRDLGTILVFGTGIFPPPAPGWGSGKGE
jgi:hypothetical protein